MTIASIEGIRFNVSEAHLVPFYVHDKARKYNRPISVHFPDTNRTIEIWDARDIVRDLENALMLRAHSRALSHVTKE